ncbi:MAG: hypothetical protein P4N59_13445 [Negativicutes bacterium]|nr:hypothetical protein [Negativicutes bacterium]
MKKNRDFGAKLLLLLGMAILTCMSAFANPVSQLNLSVDQKNSIQSVIRQANDQVRQIKSENQADSPRELKKEYENIRAVRTKALKKIQEKLTPEQQTSIEQLLSGTQQNKEDRKEVLQNLDLTRQQKIHIAKIIGPAEDTAWEIAGNSSLDLTEISRQIHQIQKDTLQNIRQQLTEDQQLKWDSWQQKSVQATSVQR